MSNELIEELLKTKNQDEFEEIILSEKEDYQHNLSLWDEKVITHLLKISDMTREEFEWGFKLTPPKDDFDND